MGSQGRVFRRLEAVLDSWVHRAQMGWGHHRVLKEPEVSSRTAREAASPPTVKEGLAGNSEAGAGSRASPPHAHLFWPEHQWQAAYQRPEQAIPHTSTHNLGSPQSRGLKATQTPLGFCTVPSPPICPQPCNATQALPRPPRAPGPGHSLLSHLPLETGIHSPGRADGLSWGIRGRCPRATHPRMLADDPPHPQIAHLPHWCSQWLRGRSTGPVGCLGTLACGQPSTAQGLGIGY